MPNALVAVDEGMILDQREAERCRFLLQRGIQIDTTKRRLGLGDGRFERAKIPDPGCATRGFEESPVQLDDLGQREIPHQARRRYNSSFFFSTRAAAVLKSSAALARRSASPAAERRRWADQWNRSRQ